MAHGIYKNLRKSVAAKHQCFNQGKCNYSIMFYKHFCKNVYMLPQRTSGVDDDRLVSFQARLSAALRATMSSFRRKTRG